MFKKMVFLSWLAVGSAAMAADADFTLVNRTGYALNEVFISPANKKSWGADRLGDYQMPNGYSRKFKFGDTKHCLQDIKVVFTEDGSEVEWEGLNLCELDRITLRYNRKSGEVSADTE